MRRLLPLAADPIAVLVFVSIGRRNHEETDGFGGYVQTAAPFLIAVAVGWLVSRAWSSPRSLRTGIIVAVVTAAVGVLLRNLVFDEGTPPSFVLVASAFLVLFIVGWRLAWMRIRPGA